MLIKDAMRPNRLLLLIFFMQCLGYFLYVTGVIKSYRVAFVSTNIFGYGCIIVYYSVGFLIMILSEKIKNKVVDIYCTRKKKVEKLAMMYMLIAFVGFLNLTANLIHNHSIGQLVYMILRNQHIGELVYGHGNTTLCNFLIVSLMLITLIVDRNDKKTIALWLMNFVFLIVYASFLSSRILIIQGTLFSIVILVRRFFYRKKIDFSMIIIVVVMAVFLIITSGFRDYDQMGYVYTDSKFKWGISRIEDYLISTVNTSLEIDSFTSGKPSTFPENTLQLLSRFLNKKEKRSGESNYDWREKVSAVEYTNIGAFAQIYSDWRGLFVIPVLVMSFLCLKAWSLFDRGWLSGYMLWPIFFYNVLEMWRINYLGTTMAEMLLIICGVTCVICSKDFVYVRENSRQ